jgi:hypothetical protein
MAVLVINAMVGFGEVLQQIPFTVIVPPPDEEMLPPLLALVVVTPLIADVVIVGKVMGVVVKVI